MQRGTPFETLTQLPVGQGLVAPKQSQLVLVAHAGGTSTQEEGSGPESGGSGMPEHSIRQTWVAVQLELPQGVAARTVVLQTFDVQ